MTGMINYFANGEEYSPEDVLTKGLTCFGKDYIPTSAMLMATGINPETGREDIFFVIDSETPIWKHLGILRTLLLDTEETVRYNSRHGAFDDEDDDG